MNAPFMKPSDDPRERTRRSYHSMLGRCYSDRTAGWDNYGARGIRVCDRWRGNFEAFLADMGPRPEGTSLDRIDSDGNYEPGNCRWADRDTQNGNRDTSGNGNRVMTRELVLEIWWSMERQVDLARRLGVSCATIENVWKSKRYTDITGPLPEPKQRSRKGPKIVRRAA